MQTDIVKIIAGAQNVFGIFLILFIIVLIIYTRKGKRKWKK